jgi:hypothetical protein
MATVNQALRYSKGACNIGLDHHHQFRQVLHLSHAPK